MFFPTDNSFQKGFERTIKRIPGGLLQRIFNYYSTYGLLIINFVMLKEE